MLFEPDFIEPEIHDGGKGCEARHGKRKAWAFLTDPWTRLRAEEIAMREPDIELTSDTHETGA